MASKKCISPKSKNIIGEIKCKIGVISVYIYDIFKTLQGKLFVRF